jgi:ribulose 1,5-bisphosphate synthetase/thiazole synthase
MYMKGTNQSRRKFLSTMTATIAVLGFGGTRCTKSRRGANQPYGSRETIAETDVLVVGGGPGGIGAAIGAARQGARTFLIEDGGFFGGVGAWGMGMQLNQMRPKGLPRGVVHELLISKLFALGDQAARFTRAAELDGPNALLCNVEYLKVAILDALDEVGCRYLVHTRAIDAIVENNRVTGVVVATKQGPRNIIAKAVVDCTGDADIACYAGAETMTATGELSPSTLLYNTGNVTPEYIKKGKKEYIRNLESARKEFPLIHKGMPGINKVANSRFYYTNHPGTRDLGEFDASDPFQFSEAECLSRRQVLQSVEALRKYAGEGLKEIEIFGAGPRIGVRESRRLLGEYVLTEENALEGTMFDDVVAWRSGNLDIGHVRLSRMKIHDVPFRSLLPVSVDGLLVAGRCISTTHVAASAGKSMGNCFATGHAAGIASALASEKGKVPRELPVSLIQDALREDGVDLNFSGQAQDWL